MCMQMPLRFYDASALHVSNAFAAGSQCIACLPSVSAAHCEVTVRRPVTIGATPHRGRVTYRRCKHTDLGGMRAKADVWSTQSRRLLQCDACRMRETLVKRVVPNAKRAPREPSLISE